MLPPLLPALAVMLLCPLRSIPALESIMMFPASACVARGDHALAGKCDAAFCANHYAPRDPSAGV